MTHNIVIQINTHSYSTQIQSSPISRAKLHAVRHVTPRQSTLQVDIITKSHSFLFRLCIRFSFLTCVLHFPHISSLIAACEELASNYDAPHCTAFPHSSGTYFPLGTNILITLFQNTLKQYSFFASDCGC
jgi:hypothetical protein